MIDFVSDLFTAALFIAAWFSCVRFLLSPDGAVWVSCCTLSWFFRVAFSDFFWAFIIFTWWFVGNGELRTKYLFNRLFYRHFSALVYNILLVRRSRKVSLTLSVRLGSIVWCQRWLLLLGLILSLSSRTFGALNTIFKRKTLRLKLQFFKARGAAIDYGIFTDLREFLITSVHEIVL